VCAGKKIHEILLDVGNVGVRDIAAKYVQECQLMSDLRHPNITQFLGLCFLPNCQLPVLVMERLDSSLDDLLESVPNIPLALKRSMLEDVARGLLYLHNHDPQIIHRDLTAKNVLLTPSLVAKITDFGNSRIVNIQPGQIAQTLSRNPGTLVYMPPEALTAAARYGPSMDIFSFGHLGIFVGLQVGLPLTAEGEKWPGTYCMRMPR
jgi:serine/threonine protein kinase